MPHDQPTTDDFAYRTIEEYEQIVGFKVNEAFKLGWLMARTTNSQLAGLTEPQNGNPAPQSGD